MNWRTPQRLRDELRDPSNESFRGPTLEALPSAYEHTHAAVDHVVAPESDDTQSAIDELAIAASAPSTDVLAMSHATARRLLVKEKSRLEKARTERERRLLKKNPSRLG